MFKLSLNENELEELNLSRHTSIKLVEARKNKLVDKIDLSYVNTLTELYLAEN